MFCFQNSSYLVTSLNQRQSQILEKLEKAKRKNGSIVYAPTPSYPSSTAKIEGFNPFPSKGFPFDEQNRVALE